MVSTLHHVLTQLFCTRPQLANEVLVRSLHLDLPGYATARAVPGDLSANLYADGVIVYDDDCGATSFAVVIEPQLKYDGDKLFSWPAYLSLARYTYRCPTYLLVVCPNRSVADRYTKQVIELGHPGFVLHLLVLRPDVFPVVRNHTDARAEPELAVLSGIAHGHLPEARDAAFYAIDQVAKQNYELAVLYHDVVMAALPEQIRRMVEDEMTAGTWEYQSDYAKTYFAKGKEAGFAKGKEAGFAEGEARGEARGEAKAVIAVLESREIPLTTAIVQRIVTCTDQDQLRKWLDRVATIISAEQLFT